LVLAYDATERTRLEARLSQAHKMEAVGRLAGGVAHDFNNLLGVIRGYADLLLEEVAPERPEHSAVEQIRRASERGAELTNQLLAFSRQQAMQPRILDLGEVVAEVATMLRRLIGADILLVTTMAGELGRIRADRGQLEQVLVNLAVNARDAMPGGGCLTIETSNVELGEDDVLEHPNVKPGPFVMLAVSDTGTGMDAATLRRLFEPFFTTKEVGHGTGLGLATVLGIVEQSGGSLKVTSRPGAGACFKAYFPQVEGAEPELAVALPEPPAGGAESILLVEDSDALRSMIGRILSRAGYAVNECAGAEGALVYVAASLATPPQLLISDVVMPKMNGLALVRKVREILPGVRVLFMSGYSDREIGIEEEITRGTPYIQKPFAREELLRAVREVLDHDAPPAPPLAFTAQEPTSA
jgi:nitrogen-specific signal transduction histidine kinase/ActR/RegA family two-component response regulator